MAGLTAATPTISDTTPAVDQTLTARPGTWGPSPVTHSYQWHRGSTVIPGATAVNYRISGTKVIGQTLTANPGTWSQKPDSLSYRWYRSGVVITGVTKATYLFNATDKGSTMTVKVTARKAGYDTASRTSVVTGTIT